MNFDRLRESSVPINEQEDCPADRVYSVSVLSSVSRGDFLSRYFPPQRHRAKHGDTEKMHILTLLSGSKCFLVHGCVGAVAQPSGRAQFSRSATPSLTVGLLARRMHELGRL